MKAVAGASSPSNKDKYFSNYKIVKAAINIAPLLISISHVGILITYD